MRWVWRMLYVHLLCLSNHGCSHSNWTREAVPVSNAIQAHCRDQMLRMPWRREVGPCYWWRDVSLLLRNETSLSVCLERIAFGGCWNKWAQTGWLKTTENPSLPILGARSPKSRCGQGRAPWRLQGRVCSLRLPAPGLLGLVPSSVQPRLGLHGALSSPVCLASLLPPMRMHVFGFRAWDSEWSHLKIFNDICKDPPPPFFFK